MQLTLQEKLIVLKVLLSCFAGIEVNPGSRVSASYRCLIEISKSVADKVYFCRLQLDFDIRKYRLYFSYSDNPFYRTNRFLENQMF